MEGELAHIGAGLAAIGSGAAAIGVGTRCWQLPGRRTAQPICCCWQTATLFIGLAFAEALGIFAFLVVASADVRCLRTRPISLRLAERLMLRQSVKHQGIRGPSWQQKHTTPSQGLALMQVALPLACRSFAQTGCRTRSSGWLVTLMAIYFVMSRDRTAPHRCGSGRTFWHDHQ